MTMILTLLSAVLMAYVALLLARVFWRLRWEFAKAYHLDFLIRMLRGEKLDDLAPEMRERLTLQRRIGGSWRW